MGKDFPKPLELEIFSLTYNGVTFFSALYTARGKFFSAQDIAGFQCHAIQNR